MILPSNKVHLNFETFYKSLESSQLLNMLEPFGPHIVSIESSVISCFRDAVGNNSCLLFIYSIVYLAVVYQSLLW